MSPLWYMVHAARSVDPPSFQDPTPMAGDLPIMLHIPFLEAWTS